MKNSMPHVVVSLTSYPPRIGTVDLVVRSLLAQTVKPWKIVLWLAQDEFPDGEQSLPVDLVALTNGTNFEIGWCENIRSYKKLIPALRNFTDCVIVTVDDDLFYPSDTLERLLKAHEKSPEDIQSMWVRIVTAKNGVIQPFLNWLPTWIDGQNSAVASFDNYLLGGSPTCYPPHCLDDRVFDMDLAQRLCPNQDDLWFWTMAVLRGTKIHGVSCKEYTPTLLPGTQANALWTENQDGGNDKAIEQLFVRFPDAKAKLALLHRPLPKNARHLGGFIRCSREETRSFSVRLNIPLFQMKYNADFSEITYYILKIPVYRKWFSQRLEP